MVDGLPTQSPLSVVQGGKGQAPPEQSQAAPEATQATIDTIGKIEFQESVQVVQALAAAKRYAERAGDSEVRRRHLLYAMTLEPETREFLASKRVDVKNLSERLFSEIYPKGARAEHEGKNGPLSTSRLMALRFYAARIALSRKSQQVEIGDLLEAFKFESHEQKGSPSPVSRNLRDSWDEAQYLDATYLASQIAQELVAASRTERLQITTALGELKQQLNQRGLLKRMFGKPTRKANPPPLQESEPR